MKYLYPNGKCSEEFGHEYAEKICPICGAEFCFACSPWTNVHEGGKYNPDEMHCPDCGHDYFFVGGEMKSTLKLTPQGLVFDGQTNDLIIAESFISFLSSIMEDDYVSASISCWDKTEGVYAFNFPLHFLERND